jgi:hypothetical protein
MNEISCHYEKSILVERKWFFIFSFLSLIIPILSLSDLLKPACETLEAWFQRSGATSVVFAIFAEFKADKMLNILNSDMVGPTFQKTYEKYLFPVKAYRYAAISFIVLGTLIWGYGDLLFKI